MSDCRELVDIVFSGIDFFEELRDEHEVDSEKWLFHNHAVRALKIVITGWEEQIDEWLLPIDEKLKEIIDNYEANPGSPWPHDKPL
jgi:hypothetical protein